MAHPGYTLCVTGTTLGLYSAFVVYVQPFADTTDLVLTLVECGLCVAALWFSWMTESEAGESEVPAFVRYGMWSVLALQGFYLPFTAWPILKFFHISSGPLSKAKIITNAIDIHGTGAWHKLVQGAHGWFEESDHQHIAKIPARLMFTKAHRQTKSLQAAMLVLRFKRNLMRGVQRRRREKALRPGKGFDWENEKLGRHARAFFSRDARKLVLHSNHEVRIDIGSVIIGPTLLDTATGTPLLKAVGRSLFELSNGAPGYGHFHLDNFSPISGEMKWSDGERVVTGTYKERDTTAEGFSGTHAILEFYEAPLGPCVFVCLSKLEAAAHWRIHWTAGMHP